MRLRPADERGMALVLAVLILFVLSITLVSVITFTGESARHASRNKAGQQAYSLAEAGYNNALSAVAALYPSGNTALDPGTRPASSQAYTAGTASWTTTFAQKTKPGGGLDPYRGTWTITATGSVSNPTGPGMSAVTRTLTAKFDVYERPKVDPTPPTIWNYVYSGQTGATCDLTIDQGTAWTSPLYMPGNLCLRNTGQVLQPSSLIAVGGNVTIEQKQGNVGTDTDRIENVYVAGTCKYWTKAPRTPCEFNNNNVQVWATNGFTYMPSPGVSAPTVDWDDVYDRASPGPNSGCTTSSGTPPVFDNDTVRNGSVATTFNLTPQGSNYTCKSISGGELSWNSSSNVLTINGIVFIDGPISIDTKNTNQVRYSGSGNIYTSGTISFQNNSTLCAKLSGSNCDTNWNPGTTDGMLTLASASTVDVAQSQFQGSLYGATGVTIGNSSTVIGPVVTPGQISPGQQVTMAFPSALVELEIGSPGDTTAPEFALGPPYDVSD